MVDPISPIGRLDPPPVEYSDFTPTMRRWLSDTIDILNAVLSNTIINRSADIGGSGAGPIDVAVTGLTANSNVFASIVSSSNTVAIAKILPGKDKFSITFTADPGAHAIISYAAFIGTQ